MSTVTILQNDQLAITFGSDGSIRSLLNRVTSCEYIVHPDRASLFRVLLPLDDWDGHHLDNIGLEPEVETWVEAGRQHIRLTFDGLHSNHGDFEVRVICTAALEGASLSLGVEVKNFTGSVLTEVWYPYLGGLQTLSPDPQQTTLLVPGFFHGAKIQNPHAALECRNGWLTTTPGGGRRIWFYPRMMQWVDYANADEGLYFAMLHAAPRVKAFLMQRANNADPAFAVTWVRYPHLGAGERFQCADYCMAIHTGDWHAGADLYRKWLETWLKPCDVSPAIRESIGWHFAFLRQGDGELVRAYDDLPQLLDEAKAAGLDALQLFGAHEAGMDRGYPDYEPIRAYGGAAALRQAMDRIAALGGRAALYQAGIAANLFCGRFSDQIETWAVKTGLGEVNRADWTWNIHDANPWRRTQPFVLMCYGSAWRDVLLDTAETYIRDYGATAVHLDHIGDFEFALCYDSQHRHDKPDEAPEEITEIFKALREKVKALNPDAAIHVEGLSELSAAWVDVHWGQNSLDRMPEVIRYTLPDLLFTTTIQENDYLKAAQAFVYGLLFDVCIELGTGSIGAYPAFGAYIHELANLRKQLRAQLVYGRFMDGLGIDVPEGLLAKAYATPSAVAIPVLNMTDHEDRFAIQINTELLGIVEPLESRIFSIDGLWIESSTTTLDLAPGELKVILLTSIRTAD